MSAKIILLAELFKLSIKVNINFLKSAFKVQTPTLTNI